MADDVETMFEELAEQNDWSAADQVLVLMRYIQRLDDDAAFMKFLRAYPAGASEG